MLHLFRTLLAVSLLACPILTAHAQEGGMPPPPTPSDTQSENDLVPAVGQATALEGAIPAETTEPILRLTPDKIHVIRLDRNAASVLVGNAKHLAAMTETPRQILLIPRAPGATEFRALDAHGKLIMARAVIVAAPQQDYVRVRRMCPKDDVKCQEYSVFYCPDMCHTVATASLQQPAVPIKAPAMPASGDSGNAASNTPAAVTGENTAESSGNEESSTPTPEEESMGDITTPESNDSSE